MKQTTVPMKEDARLVIKTGDSILIEGIDQAQMIAIVEEGDSFRMKDEGGVIYVRAESEAKLAIPKNASIVIEKAGGDLGILNFNGHIAVQKVGGDFTFQKVKDISVDSVGGDCFFKEVTGQVEINKVGGDLDGYKFENLKALSVGGDTEISGVLGSVEINTGGDARAQFSAPAIRESHIRAGGDIDLSVSENTQVILNMKSSGESINVNACGQHLESEASEYSLPLGEGGNSIELVAGGEINVDEGKESMGEFSFVFDDLEKNWHDFGREIEEKIRQSMKGVNHSLKQAGWQANEAMQRSMEKMRGFPFSGDASREGKVYGFSFDNAPQPEPKKEKKGVSDDERMMVLKMLQEKKITVEEAEKLLQALEG